MRMGKVGGKINLKGVKLIRGRRRKRCPSHQALSCCGQQYGFSIMLMMINVDRAPNTNKYNSNFAIMHVKRVICQSIREPSHSYYKNTNEDKFRISSILKVQFANRGAKHFCKSHVLQRTS